MFVPMAHSLPLALIGDIGGGELLVIMAAVLMLFGGKKLPSIARTLGKTVEDLRRASQDFRDQLMNADREPNQPLDVPPPPPIHGNHNTIPGTPFQEDPPNPATSEPAGAPDDTVMGADVKSAATASVAKPPSQETPPRDFAG